MSSTFSGIGTALSSLIAQRQALDVSGQNVANANTAGYTRQRAEMTPTAGSSVPTMWSTSTSAGNGVSATSITRMGDAFLDTRLRSQTSAASYQSAHATTLSQLESSLGEPSDTGLASALQTYWADWQDVANAPDNTAARTVLLGDANALVSHVSAGYRAVDTQWSQLRTQTSALVTQVNTTATAIADLNDQIRSITVSGGNANELIDRRGQLVTSLSGLVGATAKERSDGTMDVMIAGNPLVRGDRAGQIEVQGSWTMAGTLGEPPAAPDPVKLAWSGSGTPLNLEGGTLAANISDLAPGGSLAGAASAWNSVATSLATTVNTLHSAGNNLQDPPTSGGDFFSLAASTPAALGLSVAITDPKDIAAADPTAGALDGSWADKIAQQATAASGPDKAWSTFVVDVGVRTRAATQRSDVLEASRSSAENLQLSATSVDLDEESVNMLAFQRAYQGAARVMTTMDEMLDTLINHTGVVGR
jgi:flagellar hook-associated protein 1 FlgK